MLAALGGAMVITGSILLCWPDRNIKTLSSLVLSCKPAYKLQ